jgi:signal transduction histidine kinase
MGETQVGQISLANPERDYDEKDLELLQRLADLYAVALLRMWSEDELEEHRAHLEDLVKQRTMELNEINRQLEEEVLERKSKEKALSQTASRLRALSVRLQSIREEERRAIALDVHDKLGQSLTGLKISASLLKKKYSQHAGMCERIDGMSELIDDTIRTVREISSDLRPGMLDDFGLLPALDWQLKKFGETTGLGYELQSNLGEEIIDKDVTVALFRIAQEALTNVARHARATRVDVSLFRDEGNLTLKIADDGKGISESQTSGFASLGILGMKERALVFGGKVDLKGEPGKGTILIAQIPYGQVRMDISGEDFEVRS